MKYLFKVGSVVLVLFVILCVYGYTTDCSKTSIYSYNCGVGK